jgi:hypothetical protein
MGNSFCAVSNRSNRKLCILTFNEADLLYNEVISPEISRSVYEI